MSKAAVDMQAKYYAANTSLIQMTESLKALESGETQAAAKADKLGSSLGGLNRTVSLETVINGIGRITGGLEQAAQKAVQLGKQIWDDLMDSARWADDSTTMAQMYGVDLDTFLRVQKLVENGMDTSVEAILKSQQKLRKGVGDGSKDVIEALQELGIAVSGGKFGETFIGQDSVDLFWEAGQAIMALGDEFQQESLAQKLFGKSWHELVPLFEMFKDRDAFTQGLQGLNVNSTESVENLAELNDRMAELKGNFDTLKREVEGSLAPALSSAAEVLSKLLGNVLEYLEKPEGQQALKDMETAVSGLFSDLSKIDPEQVVEGFKGVFDDIVGGLQWLTSHSGMVIGALETIIAGWAALKLSGGALQVLQLINGLRNFKGLPADLTGGGGGSSGGTGGGWTTGLMNGLTSLGGKAAGWITSVGLPQLALAYDYLMNGTPFGQTLNNGGSLGDAAGAQGKAFIGWLDQIGKNAGDWWNTTQGLYGNALDFWGNFWGNWGAQHSATNSRLFDPNRLQEEWNNLFGPSEVTVEPVPEEGSAEKISEEVGVVQIPAELVPYGEGWRLLRGAGGAGSGGRFGDLEFHANGLPYVPFDGYGAILHKGERVIPARAMSNTRNYNSNLYIENMTMNNGQDADGLAAKVSAAQRWENRGFGS